MMGALCRVSTQNFIDLTYSSNRLEIYIYIYTYTMIDLAYSVVHNGSAM